MGMSACPLVVLACESLHVCTVCIWCCEHARFCVEVFYALYINFHSFICRLSGADHAVRDMNENSRCVYLLGDKAIRVVHSNMWYHWIGN